MKNKIKNKAISISNDTEGEIMDKDMEFIADIEGKKVKVYPKDYHYITRKRIIDILTEMDAKFWSYCGMKESMTEAYNRFVDILFGLETDNEVLEEIYNNNNR